MIKENLYCIPYENKYVLRNSKRIAYHCERESPKPSTKHEVHNKSPKQMKKGEKHKKSETETKMVKCDVCERKFKNLRAMNIHKTKQNHHVKLKQFNDVVKKNKRNRDYSLSPLQTKVKKV